MVKKQGKFILLSPNGIEALTSEVFSPSPVYSFQKPDAWSLLSGDKEKSSLSPDSGEKIRITIEKAVAIEEALYLKKASYRDSFFQYMHRLRDAAFRIDTLWHLQESENHYGIGYKGSGKTVLDFYFLIDRTATIVQLSIKASSPEAVEILRTLSLPCYGCKEDPERKPCQPMIHLPVNEPDATRVHGFSRASSNCSEPYSPKPLSSSALDVQNAVEMILNSFSTRQE